MDLRVQKIAKHMVEKSVKIKKGDEVEIWCQEQGRELALECAKLVLKKGALPRFKVTLDGYSKILVDNIDKNMIKATNTDYTGAKDAVATIRIRAPANPVELSNSDAEKIGLIEKSINDYKMISIKKDNWVLTDFPTDGLAQAARMSKEELTDILFSATLQDYSKMKKQANKLLKLLNKAKEIRIIGKDTDLTLNVKGRKWLSSLGEKNLPDGEVFTSPIENSAEGKIYFEWPQNKMGNEVEGLTLEFKNGRVTNMNAIKNKKFMKKILKTDKGSSLIGEIGIGLNYGLIKPVKMTIPDEKIGGTIHIAIGASFEMCKGKNKSGIHWDLVKNLKENGKIIVDGKIIQKNGKFTI